MIKVVTGDTQKILVFNRVLSENRILEKQYDNDEKEKDVIAKGVHIAIPEKTSQAFVNSLRRRNLSDNERYLLSKPQVPLSNFK